MNVEYEKQIGRQIRALRRKRRLTQEALAAQMQTHNCDITRSALAKIEAGQRHIYPDELKLLKELLSVPYEELFV